MTRSIDTDVKIEINDINATIKKVFYVANGAYAYECRADDDGKSRFYITGADAIVILNGVKIRAFDKKVLEYCEMMSEYSKTISAIDGL